MIAGVRSGGRGVVVGGGLLGLSAAWALSRRGWSVRVLEAGASLGHERSGSKGDARIFRLGYREARYVEMALLARDLWRSLESSSGRTLLRVTGQVSFGDAGSVADVARALALHGVPGELVEGSAAVGRLAPGLVTHGPVLSEPASGVLAADACLGAFVSAGDLRVEFGRRVASLRPLGAGVSVSTSDGEVLEADVAVVCAGPSSLGLVDGVAEAGGVGGVGGVVGSLAAGASLPQVAYFRVRGDGAGGAGGDGDGGGDGGGLPVFIEWGNDMTYGLPVLGDGPHAGLFKVSHHTPGTALERYDPADPVPMADDDELLGSLCGAIRRLLPGLDPTPVATERCVYDNSDDTDFVLDRVGPVVVGCATSGHGFKFGPLFGRILADLAEEVPPPVDLAPFRIARSGARSG
jgi:sarcosine oxidase